MDDHENKRGVKLRVQQKSNLQLAIEVVMRLDSAALISENAGMDGRRLLAMEPDLSEDEINALRKVLDARAQFVIAADAAKRVFKLR